MDKKLAYTVLAIAALSLVAWSPWSSVYKKRIPQVVQIGLRTSSSGGVGGSGVMLGTKGIVLTAAHVVDALETVPVKDIEPVKWPKVTPRYKVRTSAKEVYACTTVKVDKFRDLALIECDGLKGRQGIDRLSTIELVPGAVVSIIAAPKGFHNSITQGVVFQQVPEKGKNLFDITSAPGASGGPIFDELGDLVGIVQFGYIGFLEAFGNILGGSNQEQLRKFLATVPEGRI